MDMELVTVQESKRQSESAWNDGRNLLGSDRKSGSGLSRDAADLARVGKKDVLKRRFGLTSIIGFTCSLMLTWEAIMMNLGVGLENGGPAGLVYGYIGVWIGFISVSIVMGELASMMPTAGGQYHWTSILAPPSAKRFVSYITAAIYLAGSVLQSTIASNNPQYDPKGWHVTLMMWAVLGICTIMNTCLGMVLPIVEVFILIIHVFGFFAVLIPLLYLGPRAKASAVFATSYELGGWNDVTLATFIGMKGAVAAFLGTDGAVHMAEEVANSSTAVPQSMLAAVLINGGMGFGIMIAFLFTAGDITTILKSGAAYPFINILEDATGSKSAAITLSSMVSALQICAGLAGISSGSRMLWAFSREKAIPGWQWISQVQTRVGIPFHSTVVIVIAAGLLALINIGSSVVLNIILSLVLQAFFTSYIISLSMILYRRWKGDIAEPAPNIPREVMVWGPFRLKGWMGIVNNIFAIIFSVIMMFFGCWPTTKHPAPSQVNYSVAIFVGVTLLCIAYYFVRGRKLYKGPVVEA
ncbi:choline transport protein [Penicillium herquei]|nr:choline transport protein [Penicillium herquei]